MIQIGNSDGRVRITAGGTRSFVKLTDNIKGRDRIVIRFGSSEVTQTEPQLTARVMNASPSDSGGTD